MRQVSIEQAKRATRFRGTRLLRYCRNVLPRLRNDAEEGIHT